MVEKEKLARPAEEEEEEQQQQEAPDEQEPKRAGFLARLLTTKWLLILLAVSIVGHAIGFAYFTLTADQSAIETGPEVSLGLFRFEADPTERGQISSAEFSLHIALLSQVEVAARRELRDKKFRVQQAVEELTRRAHSGDFDDPLLAGMKQRLQEQINEALGTRVIADVIITDLKLERNPNSTGMITEMTGDLPWTEKPSG